MSRLRTDFPLLVSTQEAGFQLGLSQDDILDLIREGDIDSVSVRGRVLVVYDSLLRFTRRARRLKGAEVMHLAEGSCGTN